MASSLSLSKHVSSELSNLKKAFITQTKPRRINITVTTPRSELNTNYEMNIGNILYSTPLKRSFVTDSNVHFTKSELRDAVLKVREVIRIESSKDEWLKELVMIDSIQRVGVEDYFVEEIHAILERQYERFCSLEKSDTADNLHEVALRFRLLRQHGYNLIAAETFNKFMDNGIWRQEWLKDTTGLISLFEASHLSISGDDILDDANEFSAQLLKDSLNEVPDLEATLITMALSNPYLRSLPRLMARNIICNFENYLKVFHNLEDPKYGWTNEIQDLARMNFNMAQITHQEEISHVHSWWKELNLNKELKLARDQTVKWHIWSLAALSNRSMVEERIELTKAISLIYIIDDIFDIYGTLEELILFTEAVNRWELYADIEGLPNSMKMCLKALHDTTDVMSNIIYTKHGCNPKQCFQKAWADLCNAYLIEAKWLAIDHMPSSNEYLQNALVSVGAHIAVVHIFYLMGQEINTKTIQHLNSFPDLVSSMATIFRLYDDLGSAKEENENGYDGSFIDYYKNDHKEDFIEIKAENNVIRRIGEAWKSLNKSCILSPSPFSRDFTTACFNITRMVPMMYNYDNHHCLLSLEKHMKSLLYETLN